MKKAQFSIEFMFVIGFIILLFLIILAFSYDRNKDLREAEDYTKINAECQRLSSLISSINIAGTGTKTTLKTNYNLTIFDNNEILIEPINISCFYIAKIENNTKVIAKQYIKIENKKGVISIENV